MRVWKDPFTPENEADMTAILMTYRTGLLHEFMSVFDEIATKLTAA